MGSTQAVQASTGNHQIGIGLLVGYLVVYLAALSAMHRVGNFDVNEPLLVLAILGVGFSLAAWLLTVGAQPLDYSVLKPTRELVAIGTYLLPIAMFVTWGLGPLRRYVPSCVIGTYERASYPVNTWRGLAIFCWG
jgi:hypothetical protein